MEKYTKDLFCANCQEITTHLAAVDNNGEFTFTCQNKVGTEVVKEGGKEVKKAVLCLRLLKFPADVDAKEFNKLVDKHESQNAGQLSVERQNDKLKNLLGITLKDAEPQKKK